MHILFTTDDDSKYGASNSLLQLVNQLKQINTAVHISVVLTEKSNLVRDFEKVGCNVYKIPYISFYQGISIKKWKFPIKYIIRGVQYWYGRLFAVSRLEKMLDVHTVNLIHSNSSREDLGAMLSNKYSIPLIWHIREFGDLDYPCYSYRNNYIKLMNESATKFIAISQAVMKHWINKGIDSKKIVQIYNGVNVNNKIKKEYPKQSDVLRFIMMGSLNETKGQHHVIKAIALLNDELRKKIQVDIVGDGSITYTNILKNLIKTNGLYEQIHLLGYKKEFYNNLNEYDCGLMCSRCEGFGRVTAEYMMAGLPVIASDTGANPEIVKDHINGLLYRYNDDLDLANKICYFINNVYLIEEMGKKSYDIALKSYTAYANAVRVFQEYNNILHFEIEKGT